MYRAIVAGRRVISACNEGVTGYIHSIFDKTVNIGFRDSNSLITVGWSDADLAPSMLVASMDCVGSWREAGLNIGDAVHFTANNIYTNHSILAHSIRAATIWEPKGPVYLQSLPHLNHKVIQKRCGEVARYIEVNQRKLGSRNSMVNLSDFLNDECCEEDLFLREFAKGIRMLFLYAVQGRDSFINPVNRLLGLGSGLTPSGDDFLAGFLLGLHFVEAVFQRPCGMRTRLSEAVNHSMRAQTNGISQHFLRLAIHGEWGRASENFMIALFQNDCLNDEFCSIIDKKLSYGAASGMDELLGMMLAIDVAVKARG